MNVKTITDSQQQPQGPKSSQKEINNQIDLQNSVLSPPKVPSLEALALD